MSQNSSATQHTPATFIGSILARVRLWPSLLWRWEARLKGVQFEGRSVFLGRPLVSVSKGSRIVLGDGVRIASSVRANPLACFQPSALRAMAPGAQLILGPNVGISATVLCAGASIEVGEGTIMGSGAMVLDHDFHRPLGEWGWADEHQTNARPVKIGRGVFVGARAIILKGVTVGDRAVIGAAAVVTCDVPPRHLAVGNPARVIPLKAWPEASEV